MSDATQQTINTGAVANDGTGESLRDAFNAVNNNFANVWAAGPVGTNVLIRNNEVTTDVTNLDLRIAANGVGNIAVASTLQPTIGGVYDLGRTTNQWGEVHAQYFYGNGVFLTGVGLSNTISAINANGVVLLANTNPVITLDAGNNIQIQANAETNTAVFSVDNDPVFSNVTADDVQANTINVESVTSNTLDIAQQANIGNITIADNTITATNTNANLVLTPNGSGVVETTANIVAPYIIGNIIGNITGNISVPGANTEVIFNDNGSAGASSSFAFNKSTNELSVAGNITATNLSGTGYGIDYVVADRGSDLSNWNAMMQMGTYSVNRLNWGGVTGAPLDSSVYVGLLEVKAANTQGSVMSVEQSFYPGTVDSNNVKIQYNRSYWDGNWTPWIRITNNEQTIDGGSF